MQCTSITYSGHVLLRMFARAVTTAMVEDVIKNGVVIEDYPADFPYPSCLILGHVGTGPLHVVVAQDPANGTCIAVTAYVPDPARWSADFKTRRTP